MRPVAKIYIATVLLLGTAGLIFADWRFLRPWEFVCVFAVAVLASVMKVKLPGIFGTLSVNYLFILFAITDMTSGEALAIGCSSALVQCWWHAAKRLRAVQVGFSTMNVAVAATVAYAFYHFPLVQQLNHGTPFALMISSLLYFGMNTAGVAGVVALTEGKSLLTTWRECYFWSFPFYLLGASLVWVIRNLDPRTQWLNVLVMFPIIYVIHYSYRIYMENLESGKKQVEMANALQQRTIEALEAAREANVLKTRFLASISHELRTPLNGIVGFAEMLHDGVLGPVNEIQRECLGDMLSCSNHLRLLIGHVLDLAKIESGKMEFNYETITLDPLVREVIDSLQAIAKGKQIEVSYHPDPRIEKACVDAGRLKQVLYNYLSNGLKFTAAGGSIHVRSAMEGEDAFRIEVEDSGIGIAPEDIPRLFSEFGQLGDSEKSKAGSGLGLAISKNIAEAQGGRVAVKSELGRGSTFTVVLPLRPRQAAGADAAAPDKPASAAEHCLSESHHS